MYERGQGVVVPREVPAHVAREHAPPEAEQLSHYLRTALEVMPDVAPVLTLGAVTGTSSQGTMMTSRPAGGEYE